MLDNRTEMITQALGKALAEAVEPLPKEIEISLHRIQKKLDQKN